MFLGVLRGFLASFAVKDFGQHRREGNKPDEAYSGNNTSTCACAAATADRVNGRANV
jgi:hypothetical protein